MQPLATVTVTLPPAVPSSTTPRPLVVFRLGAQLFALDAAQVRGALRDIEITPVPLANPEIAGLAWYGGKPVSVVDLRPYLDLPKLHASVIPSVLIVTHEEEQVALLVDKIEDVVTVVPNDFSPAPVTMEPAWRQVTSSVVEHARGLIAVIDIARALRGISR